MGVAGIDMKLSGQGRTDMAALRVAFQENFDTARLGRGVSHSPDSLLHRDRRGMCPGRLGSRFAVPVHSRL